MKSHPMNSSVVHPPQEIVDIDFILNGSPTWKDVQFAFSPKFEWGDEQYLVQGIRKHLLTQEQRLMLYEADLTVEDLLNGRYGGDEQDAIVDRIYSDWNARLGHKHFG